MTSLDDRLRAAIHAIADEPDVIVPPRPTVRVTRGSRLRRSVIPALAAIAVLVAVLVTALLPTSGGGPHRVAVPRDGALLPNEIAGLSLFTASISDAPLGQPAIAVLNQGDLGTRWGTRQVVVIGVDGRTYRRLDLAEQRGADGGDGEWADAQAVLSPDGRLVAIGDPRGGSTDIVVLNLITGERRDYPLAVPSVYLLLDWSPDGRSLALAVTPFGTRGEYASQVSDSAELTTLDLATGAFSTVVHALTSYPQNPCFTDDGRSIATSEYADRHSLVKIHPRDGGAVRTLPQLDGSWSLAGCDPDGSLLLSNFAENGKSLRLISAVNGTTLREIQFPYGVPEVLAWRSPTTPIIFVSSYDTGDGTGLILDAPFDGEITTLSTAESGFWSTLYGVDLADDLSTTIAATTAGPDRGPWPGWTRITAGAILVLIGGVVFLLLRRRRRRLLRR